MHCLTLHAQLLSRVQLFATPWTLALQAPLSMEFFKQDYWNGLPVPTLVGLLLNPRMEPVSPTSSVLTGGFLTTEPPLRTVFNPLFNVCGSYDSAAFITW